jgi:2-polyprenyl-6-methoxyphenol hydroxylase-like FAD-dependent oxidoreductase
MTEPVLIVGAGPVGLTMAAELARYGVALRIIDRAAARTDKSKALVLWPRSLELMDRLGGTGAFIAAGMRATGATIRAENGVIGHVGFAAEGTAYPFALMIPQSETERLLEEHLAAQGIQVERQVELLRFTPDAHGVEATLRHPDGREETLRTPWLLGCDGAHSAVRRGLGMAFEGETLPSEWVLADVHLANVTTPPDELAIHWHADGALVLFPITPGRWRVIADIGETDDATARHEPTLAEVQALIDRRAPGGIVASDPVWLSGFRINERKVRDYSAGHVFLAGDAAHIHSPAGGQGMNTGMQDAFNLAWKLALVATGKAAAPALLPSYSITAAATLRGDIKQGVRNFIASLVLQVPAVQRKIGQAMTELTIAYPASPLTVSGGAHSSGPAAGERMSPRPDEPPFGAGTTPRFALCAAPSPEATALIARHAAVLEPAPRPPFADGAISLVRPDGYVALVARAGDWTAVDDWFGRLVA